MSVQTLLNPSPLPNFAPDFNAIDEGDYLPATEAAIAEAKRNIEAIKSNPAAPDFVNTIAALEAASETLNQVTSIFYNQFSAVGGDELNDLAQKIGPMTSNFSSDVIMDAELFSRVRTVYDRRESFNLSTEEKTLLDETYKGFVRGGALLDEDKKTSLRAISERLSMLSPAFSNNVKKSGEAFEYWIKNENDLAGLPPSAREAAAHAAAEKGRAGAWLFTLDIPSYLPFLQYADDRAARETLWRAYTSRACDGELDNKPLILEMVKLKHERANLLGYKTHADFVLEERMAQNPGNVMAFLQKLKTAYRAAALKDLEALKAFAQKRDGIDDIKQWDVAYYSEKLKEDLFKFSSEDLRPYFPLNNVLSGCFDHFARLFGLTFKESNTYPVWHKDVQTFEVFEESGGRFIGTLYADFFPRSGKKDGAWMTSYRAQGLYRGKVERPVTAIVCNFTKPTADKPSLLTHDEVLTMFHEMGHAMHGLLSDVTYGAMAGPNVKWDFVELPSQIQENWCYEKAALDLFAGHYLTGEKIPADLIEKLRASKNFMVGWAGLRQVTFATLDMAWHSIDPADIKDVGTFEDAALKDIALFPRVSGPASASFGHIFGGGYSAGYYSYKWAEVLDSDAFELFLEKGLYDRDTAMRYRREILAKGGSEHPAVLYRNFRGRDADPDALIRREGLAA